MAINGNNEIYNILLFGSSGSGKSTTINALFNYLNFESFDKAKQSERLIQVIPSRQVLYHPETYEELVIENYAIDHVYDANDDDHSTSPLDNEHHNDEGESVTQSPKCYEFQFHQRTYRIIDTPGMNDTRGVEKDKQNFDKIIEYLRKRYEYRYESSASSLPQDKNQNENREGIPTFNRIHAICYLIKTVTTRKTAHFEYCLNYLLETVHRDLLDNFRLIFCFTFSRNSLYGPGDGYQTLKGFLANKMISYSLKNGINCFYIDNEAFQFLLAKKTANYSFSEEQEMEYSESWNYSVNSIYKMLDQIAHEPTIITSNYHNMMNTFTLIDAKKWITKLASDDLVRTMLIEKNNKIRQQNEIQQKLSSQNDFIDIDSLIPDVKFFICKLAEYIMLNSSVVSVIF